jgi:hypothetical protein
MVTFGRLFTPTEIPLDPTTAARVALISSGWDASVSMTQDQFHKGLSTINVALEAALNERRVLGGVVKHAEGAEPQDTQFSVTVEGKTEMQVFTRQEIEDSAQAIDAPAAIKVRMLVSPFVR